MPSKYDRVLPGLKPAPVADPPYQEKVDAVKGHVRWVICLGHSTGRDVLTLEEVPRCEVCGGDMGDVADRPVTPADLAKHYAELRAVRRRLDALTYAANLRIEAITQLLVASQDAGEEGWGQYGAQDNTLRTANGDKFEVRPEVTGQVRDREAFRLWCIANGYERQLQLWPSTMNALVKERLVAGDNPPDGTEAYRRDKVVFTPMRKEPVDAVMPVVKHWTDVEWPNGVPAPINHTCQETTGMVGDQYLRCGAPARTLVQPRGRTEGPYWMCDFCANHNIHNRDCQNVTPKEIP